MRCSFGFKPVRGLCTYICNVCCFFTKHNITDDIHTSTDLTYNVVAHRSVQAITISKPTDPTG